MVCARVSIDSHDLSAQRDALQALGVEAGRFSVDHGLTGTQRACPWVVARRLRSFGLRGFPDR